jgi:hypothetical protein
MVFGNKKNNVVENIIPTQRDVVESIARKVVEDELLKRDVNEMKTKEIVRDEIRKDNIYEDQKAKEHEIQMLKKKVEELQRELAKK